MGMDEIFATMTRFEEELEKFNQNLQNSFKDLDQQHEKVNPLWDDTMEKEYKQKWTPLEESMKQYVTKDGRNYVEILLYKLNAIKRYLYGA
jgi:hypothetical protein